MVKTTVKNALKVLSKADLTKSEYKDFLSLEDEPRAEWRECCLIFEKKGDAAAFDFAKKHMKNPDNKATALRFHAPTAKQKAASAKNRAAIEGPMPADLRKVQEKMWTQECYQNPASMGKSQRKEDAKGVVGKEIGKLYGI